MRQVKQAVQDHYPSFQAIDGAHPLQEETIDSFITYKVRTRRGGKVRLFNFDLAKEIGLIDKDHPEKLNRHLEEKILEAFSLVIINEFDELKKRKFAAKDIRPNKYMATRYLQLQHPNKQGRTSGDGRSIWNGYFSNGRTTFDISSCGTGATSLSPATAIKGRFFETGSPSISYGCGYSEIDEGLGTLFFSEILHKNQVPTERVLAIIEFKNKYGIVVRTSPNLIRPSHLFNHLKQGNYQALEAMVNYYIKRQEINRQWKNVPKNKKERYQYFLQQQTKVFAEISAKYEDEYIFVWMDWDGDNILMDGGIIDYGSVRQFGLFHSEYRFNDGPRYSTSILEQKQKAKYMVQTFAQISDYLINGKKRPIKDFKDHKSMEEFESFFSQAKLNNLLYKIGFTADQSGFLLKKSQNTVQEFLKVFSHFERAKSHIGMKKVADGINCNAIFCMRDILRELPQLYLARNENISPEEFMEIIQSSYATKKDLELGSYRQGKIHEFQNLYWKLAEDAAKAESSTPEKILFALAKRSSIINKYDRITGDSITTIVDKIMAKRKAMQPHEIYKILKTFIEYQDLDPDKKRAMDIWKDRSQFLKELVEVVQNYREGL